MIEANCPKCNQRRKFSLVEKNKYKCTSCNSILNKCKGTECNQMIGFGLYCSKCVGSGLKNGGAMVITLVGAVALGALQILKSSEDNKS